MTSVNDLNGTIMESGWGPAAASRAAVMTTDHRDDIITYASRVTSRPHDPAAVLAAAEPLTAWARAAADGDDLRLRMRAMSAQHVNEAWSGHRSADNPHGFVSRARCLYDFMAGKDGARRNPE